LQKLEIFLGKGYSGNTEIDSNICWVPQNEHNPHLLLIGGSGSGKTETIKSIIFELSKNKINTLVIDFHDDFKQLSDNIIDFEKTGATIHPLEIQPNERPIDVAYRVSQMFKNIFHLGDIQFSIIRESIKEFYVQSEIIDLHQKNEKPVQLLPFIVFKKIMLSQKMIFDPKGEKEPKINPDVEKLISKIGVIFDTPLFVNANETTIPFKEILTKTSVLKLNDYPTDEVKSLIAEIILRKLINHLYIKGKSDLELYCVIDEAHRLAYEDSPIDKILRESRKYGLGIILASQSADDFSEIIRANTGAYLGFRANSDKDAIALSKIFQIDKSNFRNLLSPGLGYSLFSSTNKAQKLKITLVKDRPGFDKIEKNFDEDKFSEYFNASVNIEKRKIQEQERIKRELEKYIKISKEQNLRLSHKENKIIDLTNQISDLSGKVSKYAAEIADSKKELAEQSNQKEKLEKQLIDLKSELSDLVKSKKILFDKFQLLETKHKDQIKIISDLENKLEKDKSIMLSLEGNISELSNKLKNIKYLLNTERKSKQVLELAEEYGDFDKTNLKNSKYCNKCGLLLKTKSDYCDCCGEKL
jgi:hypothetical protein